MMKIVDRERLLAVALLALLCAARLAAQDPQPDSPEVRRTQQGVPLLRDIPLLSHLFQRQGKCLWYPLDAAGSQAAPEPGASRDPGEPTPLSFRERWLRTAIKSAFPDVSEVDVVEHATVRYRKGRRTTDARRGLEVFAPSTTLPKVKAWLDRFSALRSRVIVAEFKFVSGASAVSGARKDASPEVILLSEREYEDRILALKQHPKAQIISSPNLTILNGQRGNVSISNAISYVRDFDVQVVRGAAIADPIIDVIRNGMAIDVAPVIHPDDSSLSLEAHIVISSVKRPIEEMTVKLDGLGGQEVTIQVPTLSISEWKSDGLVLGHDSRFLVSGLAIMEGDWSDGPVSVEVLAHLKVVGLEQIEKATTGKVIGMDRRAKRVFVRWPGDSAFRPEVGARLTLPRGPAGSDEPRVELEVMEQTGQISICRPVADTADIRIGDTVHR